MSIVIPKVLAESGCKFIRVARNDKAAIDKDWQINDQFAYSADDPVIQDWLSKGGNYGATPRGYVIEWDVDHPSVLHQVAPELPDTFTDERRDEGVNHHRQHRFYLCPDIPEEMLGKKVETSWGDYRTSGHNSYVVGSGCSAPTTAHPDVLIPYKVKFDIPMCSRPWSFFEELFSRSKTKKQLLEEKTAVEKGFSPTTKAPYVAPYEIPEGERHVDLVSFVGKMVSMNATFNAILSACKEQNLAICKPPKEDAVLVKEVTDAWGYCMKKAEQKRAKKAETPETPTVVPEVVVVPEDVKADAMEIYREGRFIQECKKQFAKKWYNDSYMLEFILIMGAALRVQNAFEGMHLHISGDTQSGKSAGAKTALKFLSPTATMTKTFTPMAIYYAEGILHEQMVVLCDDTTQSREVAEVYRTILTSWEEGVEKLSVNQGKAAPLKVPARVSLIVTNVDSIARETDDGQDESRYITIEVRHTPDEMKRIWKFALMEASAFDTRMMQVLHAVWDCMPPMVSVNLHGDDTTFAYRGTMRETKRFATMVQAHALLCNRTTTTDEDISEVEKLMSYAKCMVNSNTAPMLRKEDGLKSILTPDWITVKDAAVTLNTTASNLYIAIRGKKGSFENPTGGLMVKEPRFETKVVSTPEENNVRWIRMRAK